MSETPVDNSHIVLPPKSRIDIIDGNDMLLRGSEEFYLSHRGFPEIDAYFSGLISNQITDSLAAKTEEPVQVIDIGGGVGSEAVKDIAKKYGNAVRAINVDIAHDTRLGYSANRVQAEVQHLPFPSEGTDIVFSVQLFPFLRSGAEEGLAEISRILRPGGIALINDEERFSGKGKSEMRTKLGESWGVVLEARDSVLSIDKREFPRFWRKDNRPEQFLVIRKPL